MRHVGLTGEISASGPWRATQDDSRLPTILATPSAQGVDPRHLSESVVTHTQSSSVDDDFAHQRNDDPVDVE